MADHAVAADDRRVLLGAVHHGAVLDRRALPHRDVSVVAAQDGVGPDGRIGADRHVPDHGRIRVDVRIRRGFGARRHPGHRQPRTDPTGTAIGTPISANMAVATTLETLSPKELGKHLRDVRRRKGLSLSEVARGAGLTRRELNAYEKGRIPIPDSDLFVLAGSCGVDVAELRVVTTPRRARRTAQDVGHRPRPGGWPPTVPSTIEDTVAQLRRSHDARGAERSRSVATQATARTRRRGRSHGRTRPACPERVARRADRSVRRGAVAGRRVDLVSVGDDAPRSRRADRRVRGARPASEPSRSRRPTGTPKTCSGSQPTSRAADRRGR